MTEYKAKSFISVWQSDHIVDTPFRRWAFPFRIVMKDSKTKNVEIIKECGWFSHKLKTTLEQVDEWDYDDEKKI